MSSFHFGSESPSSPISASPGPAIDPSLSGRSMSASPNPSAVTFRPDPQVALFVDSLAQRFHLTAQQTGDLHGLYQLAMSLADSLGRADVMSRIYMLACQYGSEQRILYAIQTSQGSQDGVGDLRALFQELSIRLKDTFQLTKDQRTTTRRLSQELIYKASRTNFKNLHLDVDRKLRAKPELHGMENIFGQLAREGRLMTETRRIASNVRNNFRQEILDSMIGEKRCSVEQFTTDSCIRYRQGMKSSQFEQGYLIHNVLLRRVAWDNKAVLKVAENEDAEGDGSTDEEPPKKRKKSAAKGRVAEGEDFWSKVDEWFNNKIELWGSDFKGEEWKRYIEESLKLDDDRHNKRNGKKSNLPASPAINFTAASASALPPQSQTHVTPSAGMHSTVGSPQVPTTSFNVMAAFSL